MRLNSIYLNFAGNADRLFTALSAGGQIEMTMADMPWGDYCDSYNYCF